MEEGGYTDVVDVCAWALLGNCAKTNIVDIHITGEIRRVSSLRSLQSLQSTAHNKLFQHVLFDELI